MERAFTAEELAQLYPHLTPEQRIEQERWHRGRTHSRMIGEPVDENAQPPYPERRPKESRFSVPPSLGQGTGTDVGNDLDRSDPDFLVKLAERAGFTIKYESADQPPD